jgi:hypothetical protein
LLARDEEEPTVVAAVEASGAPPPSVLAAAMEEGQMAAGTTAPQAALEPPAEAGPSGGDVVMVLDEDSAPPPPSGGRDAVMAPVSEPAPVVATADPFPTVEVSEPSPVPEVLCPSPTVEAAKTSSNAGVVTVEEVMELATCRYIDFPGVGVINLEALQLPEKVLDVATERMFAEPTIMETIASVSKALHEYESVGSFTPPAASEVVEEVPEGPAAGTESAADAPTPPPTSERREAPLPSQLRLLKLQPLS